MDISRINGAGLGQDALQNKTAQHDKKTGSFDSVLNDAIGKVSEVQNEAEKAIKELSGGGDVTQAIVSMQKADISFQVMVEVRNKLLSAYDEIMKMQV